MHCIINHFPPIVMSTGDRVDKDKCMHYKDKKVNQLTWCVSIVSMSVMSQSSAAER